MWATLSNEASLESAVYRKSTPPVRVTGAFQVSIWVVTSAVLPSVTRKVIGTAPSAFTVNIHTSCFKSGRWSLLNP